MKLSKSGPQRGVPVHFNLPIGTENLHRITHFSSDFGSNSTFSDLSQIGIRLRWIQPRWFEIEPLVLLATSAESRPKRHLPLLNFLLLCQKASGSRDAGADFGFVNFGRFLINTTSAECHIPMGNSKLKKTRDPSAVYYSLTFVCLSKK